MHMKLTDRVVAGLPLPASGRYDCWDQLLPSFGIRISGAGSRTWITAIRREGLSSSSRIALGRFPGMNTATAREAARALMAGDTRAPASRRTGRLFEDYAAQFLDHGRDRRGKAVRPSTARVYRFVLEQVATPFHGRVVAEGKIKRGEIAELLHTVAVERGAATAALTRSALRRFFGYLVEMEKIDTNPVVGSPIYEAGTGSRTLEDEEIAAIWGPEDQVTQFRSILRLLLLTGARRSECGGMLHSEIKGSIWTVPASRRKNKIELRLPLPPAALAEIERQPRVLGRDNVFGVGSVRGFTDWGGHKQRLDRTLGFTQPWRIQDIRRTTRTRLHKIGISPDVVVRILGHGVDDLSRRYNHHDYEPEIRKALRKWERELLRIVRRQ
jgi:integrase